jgi:hypothetical protein
MLRTGGAVDVNLRPGSPIGGSGTSPKRQKKMDDNWGFAHGLENLHISNIHYIHIYIYCANY